MYLIFSTIPNHWHTIFLIWGPGYPAPLPCLTLLFSPPPLLSSPPALLSPSPPLFLPSSPPALLSPSPPLLSSSPPLFLPSSSPPFFLSSFSFYPLLLSYLSPSPPIFSLTFLPCLPFFFLSFSLLTFLPSLLLFQEALSKMTRVAEHINDMKKKYDAAVHVQEIQSLIRGWEVSVCVFLSVCLSACVCDLCVSAYVCRSAYVTLSVCLCLW